MSRREVSGRFPHLAQKLFNVPLLLHPAKAEIIVAALADRLGIGQVQKMGAWSDDELGYADAAQEKPYAVTQGIAVLPVHGTLVQKSGCMRPMSGMTGYDGLRACFLDAMADAAIRGICLDIDSPGGEAAGCFDLVDTMAARRGGNGKPVYAILTETGLSAAYAIASAADRIFVPRTGSVGSIGVISLVVDLSKALEAGGITVNIVQFGARKADGNPAIPLAPEARKLFQQHVDAIGTLFVDTVARNRGLSPAAVRDTEAATFGAAEAQKLGLADVVAAPDEAFRALLAAA